jgi:hypothetical protein
MTASRLVIRRRWLAAWQTLTQSIAFVVEGAHGDMQPLLMPLPRYIGVPSPSTDPMTIALIVK